MPAANGFPWQERKGIRDLPEQVTTLCINDSLQVSPLRGVIEKTPSVPNVGW